MATYKNFEELEVWQSARTLANKIYKLTHEGTFASDYKLGSQINGASGSIMDNVAEGFERDGSREFVQFLSVAKGSAGEVRSQLYRALDRRHISETQFDELRDEVLSVSKQLSGLMRYLNKGDFKGLKFLSEPDDQY